MTPKQKLATYDACSLGCYPAKLASKLPRPPTVAPCFCAAALLPALAMFDLPGFVLLLSRRLAAGGAEPSSPTHVMSFLALLRLAQSQQVS